MASNLDFTIRTDIPPSKIKLPIDNWRETPDVETDKLARFIAARGLQYGPIIALNSKNEYIVIDGNRRTYACKLLEKGYNTKVNGIPVTLYLPSSWHIKLLNKKYEDMTPDEIDSLRYVTTESSVLFSQRAINTKMREDVDRFSAERGLSYINVRRNQVLFNELLNYLSSKYSIESSELKEMLPSTNTGDNHFSRRIPPSLKEPIFKKLIGTTIADAFNTIPPEQQKETVKVLEKYKSQGIKESALLKPLSMAKKNAKKSGLPIATLFETNIKKMAITQSLSLEIPLDLHNIIDKLRKQRHCTTEELIVPILEKFLKSSSFIDGEYITTNGSLKEALPNNQ
jgi:hypothetical protein